MVFNATNFFDLESILVFELVGSWTLFIFLALILIAFAATRNNMPTSVTLMLIALFLMIIVATIFDTLIWVFLLLIIGFIFYFIISRLLRRS